MQSGDFSVDVLCDGLALSEQADGVVGLPFGAEYSLRFRTHNGERAVAKVWIDGVEITGGGLILPRYAHVDLHTPPAAPGSRFRFASTSSAAAASAGKAGFDTDGTKGLIKVEFQSERRAAYTKVRDLPRPRRPVPHPIMERFTGGMVSTGYSGAMDFAPQEQMLNCGAGRAMSAPVSKELSTGVTVPGSASSQSFVTEDFTADGPVVTIMLKLKGYATAERVRSYLPKSDGHLDICLSCGKQADVLSNVCRCGRRLR